MPRRKDGTRRWPFLARCDGTQKGAPAATQRSGCGGERRSGAMSEFSARRDGNEGYGAHDDEKREAG